MSSQLQIAYGTLYWLAKAEISVLYALIWGTIVFQLITGRINLRGLLADSSGPISPVKVQLLLVTLGVAGDCLLGGGKLRLLDPTTAAAGAGAGNLIYLVRKYINPKPLEG